MSFEHWTPLRLQKVQSEHAHDRTTVTAVFETCRYRTVKEREPASQMDAFAHLPEKQFTEYVAIVMAEYVRRMAARG